MNRRLPALAACAALAALAAAASPGSAALAAPDRPVTPAPAYAPAATGTGGPLRQVLLINGDHVMVPPAAARSGHGAIVAAPGSGLMMSMVMGGATYDIPQVALPYLGHGLDPALFKVASLLAAESGGRLPVRVGFSGSPPALPGITITSSGAGTAKGYLTPASARVFGAALARQFAADHAHGSYGTDGLFAHGTTISLPGTPAPVRRPPRFPMHTLTVKGYNLAGKPDTGDFVDVVNVDNPDRIDLLSRYNWFYRGTAKYSLPAGHYAALGQFGVSGAQGSRFVFLPQFTVHGSRTTVTLRERSASSRLAVRTPRPAHMLTSDLWLERTPRSGPAYLWELYQSSPSPMWINPTRVPPSVGGLRVAANAHLESPAGRRTPYEYTVSFTDPSGTIPAQRYRVRQGDLATVREEFYQPQQGNGDWSFNGSFPGSNPNDNSQWFGFIEPAGPGLHLPGDLIEYAGGRGTGRMAWLGQYQSGNALGWEAGMLLRPGQRMTDAWGAYPLHSAAHAVLDPLPPLFSPTLASADREGNTLRLAIPAFDDNQPGHEVSPPLPGSGATIAGTYQIQQNGVQVASGDAAKHIDRASGDFADTVTLAPGRSRITFTLSLTRTGPTYPLDTAITTSWRSAPVTGHLPVAWSCATRPSTRRCEVEPMMTLRYQVGGLGLNEVALSGQQRLRLWAGHLQLAKAAKVTGATLQVSFDGGKTWQAAQVSGQDGAYTATFTAPANATVTLRAGATDAAGGSIAETIADAYQTGS